MGVEGRRLGRGTITGGRQVAGGGGRGGLECHCQSGCTRLQVLIISRVCVYTLTLHHQATLWLPGHFQKKFTFTGTSSWRLSSFVHRQLHTALATSDGRWHHGLAQTS